MGTANRSRQEQLKRHHENGPSGTRRDTKVGVQRGEHAQSSGSNLQHCKAMCKREGEGREKLLPEAFYPLAFALKAP